MPGTRWVTPSLRSSNAGGPSEREDFPGSSGLQKSQICRLKHKKWNINTLFFHQTCICTNFDVMLMIMRTFKEKTGNIKVKGKNCSLVFSIVLIGSLPAMTDLDPLIFLPSSSSAAKRSSSVYTGVMSPSPRPLTVLITRHKTLLL